MSRGWESKDVESQQQAHEERSRRPAEPRPTADQLALQAKRDSLLMDRKRVQHDVETAQNPRYQEMLRKALAHIDAKLAELEKVRPVVAARPTARSTRKHR